MTLTMIIHVMIMTYNIWMSVKEAYLQHVFNISTGSDDTGIMFSCTSTGSDDTSILFSCILVLEGTGAYGPLLLAPAESLGGPSGSLPSGGNLFE